MPWASHLRPSPRSLPARFAQVALHDTARPSMPELVCAWHLGALHDAAHPTMPEPACVGHLGGVAKRCTSNHAPYVKRRGPEATLPALSYGLCALYGAAAHDFGVSWGRSLAPRPRRARKTPAPETKSLLRPKPSGCAEEFCARREEGARLAFATPLVSLDTTKAVATIAIDCKLMQFCCTQDAHTSNATLCNSEL